ncbi:MAG: acyl-CoA dehydrogenase [Desulfobacterales bacterium]|jgi:acyl-CoA dehydrogenase|nr:acyl-CoA dehydrogenase [Desulfobacteraceae bacterium]MBT4364519.1 acyl-CoA dehydrogenase [Desulfobacteraceae bacterium]MBT7086525.1 acyl-CoA dehydrogenase [Desulfobacterales bacterium]MBT7697949.1 acyl-CoA dehydrogenase [Desulfobacterales bacterium]
MINLELPKALEDVKTGINQVVKEVFRPIARKYDREEHQYPQELEMFRDAASPKPRKKGKDKKEKTGPPPEFGENMATVVSVEEMCWGDLGFLLTLPGGGLGNAAISAVATDEQFDKYAAKWAAMAITEPGSGSDSGSITTTAVLDGDEWVLNGEKIFVTCADRCDIIVVWATIDENAGKAGIKSFIVEKGSPGLKLEHLEHKMGIRASDTGTFVFKDCRIPKENILGSSEVKESKTSAGFKGVMKTFDNTRPLVAAMSTGVARAALDFLREKIEESGIAIDYNKNLNNVSAIEKEYYEMEANLEAMRLLVWKAAWMADNKDPNSLEASMSKAKAGKTGTMITLKCCELLGPMGYSEEYLVEKWARDSKILDIFEGTGQIQHLIVARNVLNLSSKELK